MTTAARSSTTGTPGGAEGGAHLLAAHEVLGARGRRRARRGTRSGRRRRATRPGRTRWPARGRAPGSRCPPSSARGRTPRRCPSRAAAMASSSPTSTARWRTRRPPGTVPGVGGDGRLPSRDRGDLVAGGGEAGDEDPADEAGGADHGEVHVPRQPRVVGILFLVRSHRSTGTPTIPSTGWHPDRGSATKHCARAPERPPRPADRRSPPSERPPHDPGARRRRLHRRGVAPEAVVLVLHGGRERSHDPVESRHLAVRRMLPFAGEIAKRRARAPRWPGCGTGCAAGTATAPTSSPTSTTRSGSSPTGSAPCPSCSWVTRSVGAPPCASAGAAERARASSRSRRGCPTVSRSTNSPAGRSRSCTAPAT